MNIKGRVSIFIVHTSVESSEGDRSESYELYLQLKEPTDWVRGRNVVLRDFNAQASRNRDRHCPRLGKYGVG